jgi:hypothetical protein
MDEDLERRRNIRSWALRMALAALGVYVLAIIVFINR